MYNALVKMKNKKGFTLIEMLVVIAIIAILVSILVPVIGISRNKAKGAVDAANVRTMAAEVATRMVSETDETKLLIDLAMADSQIKPGSYVLFYVINDNEVRAYYCNSLVFSNQLRGTVYNSSVAETGKLDSSYDTLPTPNRLLGSVAPDGTAYDSTQTANMSTGELANLIRDTSSDVLTEMGIPKNADGTPNWDAVGLREIASVISNLGDSPALMKIAMINSLMENYGYDLETAKEMVENDPTTNSSQVGTALKNVIATSDNDRLNNAVNSAIDTATGTTPYYAASEYFGCSYSWFRWTHNTEKTWQSYKDYCDNYGLNQYNDCSHPS